METLDETADPEHAKANTRAPVPRQELGAMADGADFCKLGIRPTSATPLFDDSFALPSVGRLHARSKRLAAWKSNALWPSRGVAVPLRWDSAAGRDASRSYPYRQKADAHAEFPGYLSTAFVGPHRHAARHSSGSNMLGSAAREAGSSNDTITLRDLATGWVRVPRGTILLRAEACAHSATQRSGPGTALPPSLVHQATNRHISLEAQQRHLTPTERQHRINLSLELGSTLLRPESDVESIGSD